ncbi:MAG: nicotinamide mononucleotide transporter [Saprospiraceae bacterium]|jgi:nicotinamide mononucleotide transporter
MEQSLSFLEVLNTALENMTWIEIWAVITGLIYVILAAKENIWCWFFGIISSVLSIYLFYTGKLYAESILYGYYIVAGFYGWYIWSKRNVANKEYLDQQKPATLQIHSWTGKEHILAIGAGVLLSFPLGLLLKQYTDAQIPVLDAFTTIFSFIATYMVTRKVLENWLYWIVIDIVTTGMYFYKAYYLYALLMIIYTGIAIVGYMHWQRIQKGR